MGIALIALALSPIWGVLLFEAWQGLIRPRFIPLRDLERLAGELKLTHGADAEEVAFINEYRAWCYGDTFEQALWHRVRRIIQEWQAHVL